ncbi:MAG: 50S ribosomal protein L13 [Bacteroidetes bacterium]|nr:MAG: 50S ribosomal protein L13 [Bacteroidota bacterium]
MDTLSYKTKHDNIKAEDKAWFIVDASNQTLGRLSTQIAIVLRGKHKASYSPHFDNGDNVIVINAEKVALTGKKWSQKKYLRYSGYPGGLRARNANEMLEKKPEAIVEKAVRGMLPKNRLGRALFGNLYVYTGSEHPHGAQNPKELTIQAK